MNGITNSVLMQAIVDLYDGVGQWDHIFDTGGVYVGVRYIGGDTVIVPRGSMTLADWARDGVAWIPHEHPRLGYVASGFDFDVDLVYDEIKLVAKGQIYFAGHSLGAAEACQYSGLFVLDGVMPAHILLCGCPRPGFQELATILTKVSIDSFRNGPDPVTFVPGLLEGYRHVRPLHELCEMPKGLEVVVLTDWHNHLLYQAGVNALASPPITAAVTDTHRTPEA